MSEWPATIAELQAQLQAQAFTPEQALQAQRQRLLQADAQWHCVVSLDPDPQPRVPGPLSGVALAHKDIFDLPGRTPGVGVTQGQADATRRRATALELLAQAGAHQSATLTLAPWASGATAQNPHLGPTLNPIHPAWALGGSSSGSAAAVAAGLSYFSLGTDTAGSVRIPAATCGILGLKTTHGLISTQGCAPLAPSLDTVGILARHVSDARLALQILAPQLTAHDRQPRLRFRLWLPEIGMDDGVRQVVSDWAQGHQARSANLDSLLGACAVHAQRVLCHEIAATHRQALLEQRADAAVQALGWLGLAMPTAWYTDSMALRGTLLAQFCALAFEDADVLIMPSLPLGVPDAQQVQPGTQRWDPQQLLSLHQHMGFANYLGLPVLNLPIGTDPRGRPVGVQLVARPEAEHLLLDAAQAA
jgi:Asp-tRNA(Asn)/Glu-tRNA(Gln) amidotransferase A subunit family amidase